MAKTNTRGRKLRTGAFLHRSAYCLYESGVLRSEWKGRGMSNRFIRLPPEQVALIATEIEVAESQDAGVYFIFKVSEIIGKHVETQAA